MEGKETRGDRATRYLLSVLGGKIFTLSDGRQIHALGSHIYIDDRRLEELEAWQIAYREVGPGNESGSSGH